jgi:hypothetical protein
MTMRNPLKFPPDDIGEWHQIPIPHQRTFISISQKVELNDRNRQIRQWLLKETTGPYYIKSHIAMIGHQAVDVYCFKESSDAMMFSMLWS